jgi:NAD(P)-dependent dehydrogenase (short-subunit alcohol dehydrogenase family)
MPESQKIALVTGGARGNGLAIAKALLQAGNLVYLADIATDLPGIPYSLASQADLDGAVAALREISPHVHALRCDVRSAEQVEQLYAGIESSAGGVDILVNNAGVLALNPIAEVSESEWDVQMDVIAKGAFHCARRALPSMNVRGWGRIINVASVAGHRGIGMGVAYTAAKHALIGLTRALAMEVARQNITVNAVCPGTTPTPLIEGTATALNKTAQEALEQFSSRHLTGRPIASEDIASAVVWLASDAAGRINGTSLFVDDGWHIH